MIVVENLSPTGSDCTCENEYEKTGCVLRSIDEPIQVITTSR